jgi:hypothetical protein
LVNKAKEDIATAPHSFEAFFKKLIDYAGLFPPTQLPLEEAIHHYASYIHSCEAWMIGPFVCPASQLEKLEPYLELFSSEKPLAISALGRKAENERETIKLFKDDLASIEHFQLKHGTKVRVNQFELPLPSLNITAEFMNEVGKRSSRHHITCYCEFPIHKNDRFWEQKLAKTALLISQQNQSRFYSIGGKLRTGGIKASLIPDSNIVGSFIYHCKEHKVPVKFTAGLHHPVRLYRSEVQADMHGFVNVFVAGLMAYQHHLDKESITEILQEKDAKFFSFQNEKITWRHLEISTKEIMRLRKEYLHSYGSCSFETPRSEFKDLNMIERG